MKNQEKSTEGEQAEKPVLVYDGDCVFCCRCVARLKASVGDAIDFVPLQEAINKYTNISRAEFEEAVYLILPNGEIYRSAEAVFRTRAMGDRPKKFLFWIYQKSVAFRKVSENIYNLIARNRKAVSRISKFLWGQTLSQSTYFASSWLFARGLGVVALIAFLSYWIQAEGLIGSNGIMPHQEDLEEIKEIAERNVNLPGKYWLRPTLLWFNTIFNLDILFGAGVVCSALLAIGIFPSLACLGVWVCYLSLMTVGEPFLSFQWDILLIEASLLSVLLIPLKKFHHPKDTVRISKVGRILLMGLLFKLMFESGIVKFTFFAPDGTNTWRNGSALDFHYWTQPIPHGLSWYIDRLPKEFDILCLWLMYFTEIVLPFFFFFPRNLRHFAFLAQVFLQTAIFLSGNYGYFNLLTLVLCIPLVDDQVLPLRFHKYFIPQNDKEVLGIQLLHNIRTIILSLFLIVFVWSGYHYLENDLTGDNTSKHSKNNPFTTELITKLKLTHSMNSYGLFRVMTTSRPELMLEASMDGKNWLTYKFKWKPGDLNRVPDLVSPHMPRLDWQMWFEALNAESYTNNLFSKFLYSRFLQIVGEGGSREDLLNLSKVLGPAEILSLDKASKTSQQNFFNQYNSLINAFLNRSWWFAAFLEGLLSAEPAILELLESSPFGTEQPNYIRITLWQYRFASPHAKEKNYWWERIKVSGFETVLTAEDMH